MSAEVPGFTTFNGESLYSIVARHYLLSGHRSHTDYLSNLFRSQKRIHPYLPSGITTISTALELDEKKLLYQHTLFTLFSLNLDCPQNLCNEMLRLKGSPLMSAHLPQFKLKFFSGHKYCPCCIKRDVELYGCGIWHIEHQIPGIVACASDSCRLVGVSNQDEEIDRRLILPSSATREELAEEIDVKLARYSSSLIHLLESYSLANFNPISLYRKELLERKMVTTCGRLYLQRIIDSISTYWDGLDYGSMLGIPESLCSWGFIGPLLRHKTGFPTHAIKHLLFSGWLFDCNAENFINKLKYSNSDVGDDYSKKGRGIAYLSFDPAQERRNTQRVENAFNQLEQARIQHPGWLRKDIKAAYSTAYFYLYHHAKHLLKTVLPPKVKPSPPGKNWEKEDQRLVQLILDLDGIQNMSLSEIDRNINGRGFLRKNLDKLPNTLNLIRDIKKSKKP